MAKKPTEQWQHRQESSPQPDFPNTYPQWQKERELVRLRRGPTLGSLAKVWFTGTSQPPGDELLGVGVSGGGVRSATFALGIFQALASERKEKNSQPPLNEKLQSKAPTLLREIDFLSTVSGGGYFGGFYGALFERDRPDKALDLCARSKFWEDIEDKLASDSHQVRYLRENGAYLAPAGTPDLLLGMAVLARNWVAVMFVLLALIVGLTLFSDLMFLHISQWFAPFRDVSATLILWGGKHGLLLSPLLLLAAASTVTLVVPLGWAYFLVGSSVLKVHLDRADRRGCRKTWAFWGGTLLVQFAFAIAVMWLHGQGHALGAGALATCVAMGIIARTTADYRGARMVIQGQSPSWSYRPFGRLLSVVCCVGFSLFLLLAYGPVFSPGGIELDGFVLRWCQVDALGGRVAAVWLSLVAGVALADLALQTAFFALLERPTKEKKNNRFLLDADRYARHTISVWLKTALVSTLLVLLLAVMHTLGRTIYAQSIGNVEWSLTFIGVLASLLASGARKWTVKASKGPDGARAGWVMAVSQRVAGLAALLVVVVCGVLVAQLAFYQAKSPVWFHGEQGWAWVRPTSEESEKESDKSDKSGKNLFPELDMGVPDVPKDPDPEKAEERAKKIPRSGWIVFVVLALLSICVGGLRRFLNNSTHLPLYSARITRAFLGASNTKRLPEKSTERIGVPPAPKKEMATHLEPGDDLELREYFGTEDTGPYGHGAPLHLINVTINETIDGRSQTQQNDRRGVGMAIGPSGLSVGVRHHAEFSWDNAASVVTYPSDPNAPFLVFGKPIPGGIREYWPMVRGRIAGQFPGESLSLGRWLGISGAAFTTGLGSRTNVGLSLLLGLANVRLGHWWKSGVLPEHRWTRLPGAIFWTQQYLLRELFARFSGTADRLWYLSDGGHFENMGGYELIRRRLKRIVIIDAEADPETKFEGLGNLVRKARLDFGVEIEFLEEHHLQKVLERECSDCGLGAMKQLKRDAESGWSEAHAALARVTYPPSAHDGSRVGWLLYIKPTLRGREPADVLQYHAEHQDFPQQTTGDQFFDEAQWESYRRLGECIGRRLFQKGRWPFEEAAFRKLCGDGEKSLGGPEPPEPSV